jgi:hypothetical protein
MTRWAKVSTAFYRNAKVLSISSMAAHVYLVLLLKNGEEGRDGVLSKSWLMPA